MLAKAETLAEELKTMHSFDKSRFNWRIFRAEIGKDWRLVFGTIPQDRY